MTLKQQIERARASMQQWPSWMKNSAYFEGTDRCENDAELHQIEQDVSDEI